MTISSMLFVKRELEPTIIYTLSGRISNGSYTHLKIMGGVYLFPIVRCISAMHMLDTRIPPFQSCGPSRLSYILYAHGPTYN
jgi:hypothetical protein